MESEGQAPFHDKVWGQTVATERPCVNLANLDLGLECVRLRSILGHYPLWIPGFEHDPSN